MASTIISSLKTSVQFLVDEKLVMFIIFINAGIFIALDIDPDLINKTGPWLAWVDYVCVLYFAFELISKVFLLGFRKYITDHWNKLDFIIVIFSLPILLEPLIPELSEQFSWAPLFRVTRLFRLARFLRFARLLRYVQSVDALQKIKIPAYVILLLVSINFLFSLLDLSETVQYWFHWIYGPALIFLATWLLSRIYVILHNGFIIPYFTKSDSQTVGAVESIIYSLAQVVIWALGISVTLELAGYDSTSILAGLGLGGMALALAAQDTIANLIGGFLLYLQRPFKIGDVINIGPHSGQVDLLGLRSMTIVEKDGTRISLPNKMVTSQPIKNITASELAREKIVLRMGTGIPAEKLKNAIEIISEVATAYETIGNNYILKFGEMNKSGHTIEFEYSLDKAFIRLANPDKKEQNLAPIIAEANRFLYLEIIRKFQKTDIPFNYPDISE
jgi:MscS family membrane protein